VTTALANRLKDQNSIVRELADKAEDTVWNRLKRYTVILVSAVALLAYFGVVKPLYEIYAQIQPMVSVAEQRIRSVTQTTAQVTEKIIPVTAAVDRLSRDVDAQTRRVAVKGGEISQKFQALAAAANAFSERLEIIQKSSETTIEQLARQLSQVARQAEMVSVRQAFPTLGQKMFVTLNGRPWKGKAAKGPKEKWININLDIGSISYFSTDQIETLVAALKKAGYEPLLGMLGIGGPYSTGWSALGPTGRGTIIYYFNHNSEPIAHDVAAIASQVLSIRPIECDFVSVFQNKDETFAIEQSGLDLQLYLREPQK
jgi:hypothetical protein